MSRFSLAVLAGTTLLAAVARGAPLVTNGDFESPVTVDPLPIDGFGTWEGNPCTRVGAENGVVPFSGNGMLKFGASPGGEINLWQLIDLAPYGDTGGLTATMSAQFNRAAGDNNRGLRIGLAASNQQPPSYARDLSLSLTADDDPATWEPLLLELSLPPGGADYLAIEIVASNRSGDLGHYLDAVSVTVPEPAGAALLIVGILAIAAFYRRRHVRQAPVV